MQKDLKSKPVLTSYPIDDILPEVKEAVRKHSALVLQAPPGSGKTTGFPGASGCDSAGKRAHPDAGAPADRSRFRRPVVAKTVGEEIGRTLGYSIRFDSRFRRAHASK